MRILIVFSLVLLSVNVQAAPQSTQELFDGGVASFAASTSGGCEYDEHYNRAKLMMDIQELIAQGHQAQLRTSTKAADFELVVRESRQSAANRIKLADVLTAKECFDVARELYLSVIDDFPGSVFAAARQRAQIGIDDLRAATSHPK
jgi:hypothetical protein